MPATARKPKEPPTARALAAQYADEWVAALTTSKEAFTHGSRFAPSLDDSAFITVQEALERAHVEEYGPPKNADDRNFIAHETAMEAGYLIGVQVGLRLRGDRL